MAPSPARISGQSLTALLVVMSVDPRWKRYLTRRRKRLASAPGVDPPPGTGSHSRRGLHIVDPLDHRHPGQPPEGRVMARQPRELVLARAPLHRRLVRVRQHHHNGRQRFRTAPEAHPGVLPPIRLHLRTRGCFYPPVKEIQAALDLFLLYYNLERSPQGYRPRERTPAPALSKVLALDELPTLWEPTDNDLKEDNDQPVQAA